MHLLSDIICAFGSRIGIGVYPADKTAYFMRNGRFPGIPMKLEVGVRLDGHEYMLPLAPGGEAFSFVEQEMTPTTLTLTGIDAARALSVQLTLTSLFRPQDVPVFDNSRRVGRRTCQTLENAVPLGGS